MGLTRRTSLALLLSTSFALAAVSAAVPAFSKDGSDGGGSGGSGGSGSGGSGHGGSDGGSSGSGHGSDDGGGDDHGKDDNASGKGPSYNTGSGTADYDRARDAVRDGQIMPLKTMLKKIDAGRFGRIIDIRLTRSPARDIYQLKLRDDSGTIRTLRIDAKNGSLLGDG
jgi:uncharacterized membrane protein YkoI